MSLTCPECKNLIDLSSNADVAVDHVIECPTCGISLVITKIEGDLVEAEVTDEGK